MLDCAVPQGGSGGDQAQRHAAGGVAGKASGAGKPAVLSAAGCEVNYVPKQPASSSCCCRIARCPAAALVVFCAYSCEHTGPRPTTGGGGAALSASHTAAVQFDCHGGAAAVPRPPAQPRGSHHYFGWVHAQQPVCQWGWLVTPAAGRAVLPPLFLDRLLNPVTAILISGGCCAGCNYWAASAAA